MPPELTERVRASDRSSIRHMFDLANREERTGRDLVRLEVGEPDFDTPTHITEAAAEAARAGHTHYTPNAGLLELREAISRTLAGKHGLEAEPENEITVTSGGMEALHLAMLAVADPGTEVLVPTPTWPNYLTQAHLADARPVEVPLNPGDGFALDPDRVIDAMSEATAAVVLCTPSNPTGRVYDPAAIERVVEAAVANDAYVIADEVYAGLTYDDPGSSIAARTDAPEHVLTVHSCSKTYAMTGWRIGWLSGPERVISEVTKIRESTTASTSSVSQYGAIAALTGPQEPIEAMGEAFAERREYVVDRIEGIDGLSAPRPEGAFYAFLDVREWEGTSLAVAESLLTDYGVVCAPGGGFGEAGEGFLRLSFANDLGRIEAGFDRIERAIEEEAFESIG
jgi:aspartate aminotransferase